MEDTDSAPSSRRATSGHKLNDRAQHPGHSDVPEQTCHPAGDSFVLLLGKRNSLPLPAGYEAKKIGGLELPL